ncbi:MAG: SurA N-terminal domain-containing protein [Planctomycetes bacterium]|nr:SurA N-terminal domain-containing protein [Planctomycetota bacterium]MBU4399463.1 SurA N-terminal domain-containing protein [Planctomycetota bacterium]MCG2683565.1 SurA N-terminal domain-containing protein [Planctomycetales bacterium]
MASPFQVFRKNQKLWVAGLTILVMFGFVFLPTIMDTMGGRSGSNPVAFKSKYGDLHESQLHNLRERHLRTLGILKDILQQSGYPASRIQQQLEYMFGGSTLDDVAESWLLARHAEEMGMVVSDEMINAFIKQITQNQVKVDVFQSAFKRSGVSERMFFEMMRDELLAWKLKQIFYPSVVAATPGQRWDYFCRVKRLAAIEAAPVAVADYVGQVNDPSEEELRAFFEEHKDKLPSPFSPEPGFKKPQKVALEYFKAETDKFIAPEMISDEEVMRRYEKDKQRYDQFFREPAPQTPAETAEEKPAEDRPNAADNKETETNEPVKKEEAGDKESSRPTPAAEPNPPKTERKEPAEKKKEGASLGVGDSPFVLTAFQQPEAGDKAESEPPVKSEPAPEKPQSTEKPASSLQPPASSLQPPASSLQPPASSLQPPASSLQPETGPSERLREYIRREIAGEKINVLFDRLSGQMDQYREKQSEYDFSPAAKKEGKSPPVRPDLEKLAKQNGLTAGRTGLVADWDAAESEIGSALVGGGIRAWQYAFHSMAKLRPEKAMDLGNLYLFWKTEDAKEEVPKFEDEGVREEVLRAWKMIQARELAKKEAEALAAEAREADKPFARVFAGRPKLPVLTPPPFTWMTLGSVSLSFSRQPEISAVEGVDIAGEEFMRTVFRLKPGEVGAAMNAPQTAAYAVRLIKYSPSYKVLWEQFKVDDFRKYSAVAQGDRNQMYQAWLNEIKTTAGFKWTDEHKKRLRTEDSGQ